MIISSGKHYLYRHIRLDTNKVFYIGIGTKCKNVDPYMRAKSSTHRNPYWHNIKKKTKYIVQVMLESDDYLFIIEKEKEFINLYGRENTETGTLVNMTDGGEGVVGAKRTKNWCTNISKGLIASTKPRSFRGPCSEDTKKKLSESNKGVKRSETTKARVKLARAKQDMSHCNKAVNQYTLEGNFIKEWISMMDVQRKLNIANISRAISKNLTAGGFKWEYKVNV